MDWNAPLDWETQTRTRILVSRAVAGMFLSLVVSCTWQHLVPTYSKPNKHTMVSLAQQEPPASFSYTSAPMLCLCLRLPARIGEADASLSRPMPIQQTPRSKFRETEKLKQYPRFNRRSLIPRATTFPICTCVLVGIKCRSGQDREKERDWRASQTQRYTFAVIQDAIIVR